MRDLLHVLQPLADRRGVDRAPDRPDVPCETSAAAAQAEEAPGADIRSGGARPGSRPAADGAGVGNVLTIVIDALRTKGGMNSREHYLARSRRVVHERAVVGWNLRQHTRPKPPCIVTLTRIAPSQGLDPFDNLPSSLKAAVDAVADWLGVDDKDPSVVYRAEQEYGSWGVRITFQPMV